jgi:hypothetical protein
MVSKSRLLARISRGVPRAFRDAGVAGTWRNVNCASLVEQPTYIPSMRLALRSLAPIFAAAPHLVVRSWLWSSFRVAT